MWKVLIFQLLLVGCFHGNVQSQSTCTMVNSCSCTMDDGSGTIDLSPLDTGGGSYAFQASDAESDTFYWNPCTPFTLSSDPTGVCSGVAACQERDDSSSGGGISYYNTGTQDTATFAIDYDLNVLTLQYTATTDAYRTTYVALYCDQTQEGTMTASGETSTALYKLALTSKYACPSSGPPPPSGSSPPIVITYSLSVGSILLIVFFCLICVYLIGGAIFNFFVRGARGAEVVPNSGFWTGLPLLVKDGTMFVVTKVKGGGSTGSYENI